VRQLCNPTHPQTIIENPPHAPGIGHLRPSDCPIVSARYSHFQLIARVSPLLRHHAVAAGSSHSVAKCQHRSTRIPPIVGFRNALGIGGEARLAGDFGDGRVCSSRSPELDLSVCPSVPPIEPACANAVVLAVKNARIPDTNMTAIRRPASLISAILRPSISCVLRVFATALVATGSDGRLAVIAFGPQPECPLRVNRDILHRRKAASFSAVGKR
jgi:hypothetical protein